MNAYPILVVTTSVVIAVLGALIGNLIAGGMPAAVITVFMATPTSPRPAPLTGLAK